MKARQGTHHGMRWRFTASLVLVLALALPWPRGAMEASMAVHMLVQIPLLVAAGWLLAHGLPPQWQQRLRNLAGGPVAPVMVAILASLYWMMPRALDAAMTDMWAEILKFTTLPLLVGLPLALSWAHLSPVARGFVWTNFVSMLAVLGWLYMSAPMRVCNVYLENAQQHAGRWMIIIAVGGFAGWLFGWLAGAFHADDPD